MKFCYKPLELKVYTSFYDHTDLAELADDYKIVNKHVVMRTLERIVWMSKHKAMLSLIIEEACSTVGLRAEFSDRKCAVRAKKFL